MTQCFHGVNISYLTKTDGDNHNIVYLLVFPNGKVYVGSTTMKLKYRVQRHCLDAIKYNKQYLISAAIRTHKEMSVIVLEHQTDKKELRNRERWYTEYYKSNDVENGYNFFCGCKAVFTKEHREKISKSNTGKHLSQESKNKVSSANKGENKGENSPVSKPFKNTQNHKFNCVREAAEWYNCSRGVILRALKTGKEHPVLKTTLTYLSEIL